MEIGVARESELDEIYSIEIASFRDPYPRAYLYLLYKLAGDLFLVAREGRRVVGYAVGLIRKGRVGHVVSIAVVPEYRRRGIGERLLKELLRKFEERGCERARLEVGVTNEAAIKLYRKLGFKIVRKIERYYRDGEDCYVMYRELGTGEKRSGSSARRTDLKDLLAYFLAVVSILIVPVLGIVALLLFSLAALYATGSYGVRGDLSIAGLCIVLGACAVLAAYLLAKGLRVGESAEQRRH